jgi:hypothetical protein
MANPGVMSLKDGISVSGLAKQVHVLLRNSTSDLSDPPSMTRNKDRLLIDRPAPSTANYEP